MSKRHSRVKRYRCRCLDDKQELCKKFAISNSLFCENHQTCSGSPLSGYEPPYEPHVFNKDPRVQDVHNCWDYAMNVVDPAQLTQCDGSSDPHCQPRFHQPGGTKGLAKILQSPKGRTCKTVEYLMKQDVPEITPSTFSAKCPVGTSKGALVVDKGEDYHFYREDDDGWWSHKDGGNTVKRFDAEGKPIWNPQTASRDYRPKGSFLNYNDFCGFFCAPRNKTIKLARGGGRRKTRSTRSRR